MHAGGKCIFTTRRKNIFIRPYKNILFAPCGSTYKREQSRIEDEATRCGNLRGKGCSITNLRGIFQRSILTVSLTKSGLETYTGSSLAKITRNRGGDRSGMCRGGRVGCSKRAKNFLGTLGINCESRSSILIPVRAAFVTLGCCPPSSLSPSCHVPRLKCRPLRTHEIRRH